MPIVVTGWRGTMAEVHAVYLRRRYPLAFALLDSWF
jgi:hypothetical protein